MITVLIIITGIAALVFTINTLISAAVTGKSVKVWYWQRKKAESLLVTAIQRARTNHNPREAYEWWKNEVGGLYLIFTFKLRAIDRIYDYRNTLSTNASDII